MQGRIERWSAVWGHIASVGGNVAILFTVANLALWMGFRAIDRLSAKTALEKRYEQILVSEAIRAAIYPGLDEPEVRAMIRESWNQVYEYEAVTQWREKAHAGRYVNVDTNGFRVVPQQGPWPPDPDYVNVFVFGGSTTFGYGVPDNSTIPAHLQELLWERGEQEVRVYNFGRGDYFSTPERLLFGKLLAAGSVPSLAIFVDGLNDFIYHPMWIRDLLYTGTVREAFAREGGLKNVIEMLPVGRFAKSVRALLLNRSGEEARPYEFKEPPIVVDAVITRYQTNRRLIEASAEAFGVDTLFVWQPTFSYKYDQGHHPFVNTIAKPWLYDYVNPGYETMADRRSATEPGDALLWCADIQSDLKEPLYVDLTHYTGAMARRVAECIVEGLDSRDERFTW